MIRYAFWALLTATFFTFSTVVESKRTIDKVSVSDTSKSKIDPESGLKINLGWDKVKTNCTSCHSAKIIVSQRGNRATWLEMIRWMQKKQGLWELQPKTEKIILDYLSNNYPPLDAGRRANLPVRALPKNPWQKCCSSEHKKLKVIVLKKR
jgi:hypothetical protein